MTVAGTFRAAAAAALLLAGSAAVPLALASGPALDGARSGPCVEDPKLLRR